MGVFTARIYCLGKERDWCLQENDDLGIIWLSGGRRD